MTEPLRHLPTTRVEALARGWDYLDVIFVTGDAYIDHPAFGVPLLARWLEAHGFRVGIIAQPDWRSKEPFMALGEPRLFFGVSAGAMDSMVAHYTPARKLRRDDAYTPGNRHGARPNRATIIYTSRLKEAYRNVPVVIGGIEASLRRFAHYDYWENKVRRSLLFDAKADLLIYGMGERAILELARRLQSGEPLAHIQNIRGTAFSVSPSSELHQESVSLPSFEEVSTDTNAFSAAFLRVQQEQNPYRGMPLTQLHGTRLMVCTPPQLPLSEAELDEIYGLPFLKTAHPAYQEPIPAWEQIKTSITSHRGCCGGCSFCAITLHQGKTVQSRSQASILAELDRLTRLPWFKGSVSDLGGPTANMFGISCTADDRGASCQRESCLFPRICPKLSANDGAAATLLRKARNRPGIRNLAVSSGIRHDLLEQQPDYFRELLGNHVSGLLKIAPEHLVDSITTLMRKPGKAVFEKFLERFRVESKKLGKKQSVIPYLISGHPGCTLGDMLEAALSLKSLGIKVEQVQDFTPTPGTLATCMYHTGLDPMTGKPVYVARSDREKGMQKSLLLWHLPEEKQNVLLALREMKREDAIGLLLGGSRPQRGTHERTSHRDVKQKTGRQHSNKKAR